jgi:hypothetical protein
MTTDLHVLWRERQEAGAALDTESLADDDQAWQRFPDLDEAIREARPTDPAGLAIQLRLLADASRLAVTLATKSWLCTSPGHSRKWAKPGRWRAPPRRRSYCLVEPHQRALNGLRHHPHRRRTRLACPGPPGERCATFSAWD